MRLSDINPYTMRGPGDEEPVEELVECSVCENRMPEDYMATGYLFATCEKCHEAIIAEQEKQEDGQ